MAIYASTFAYKRVRRLRHLIGWLRGRVCGGTVGKGGTHTVTEASVMLIEISMWGDVVLLDNRLHHLIGWLPNY